MMDIERRPFQDVDARIAVPSDVLPLAGRADRLAVGTARDFEGVEVKPLIHFALVARQIALADAVRDTALRVGVRHIESREAGRKESARPEVADRLQLPAPQQCIHSGRGLAQIFPALAERQIPGRADYGVMLAG